MKKRRERKESTRMVVGVAWYRREQWPRLLEVSEDAKELEETFEEWFQVADARFRTVKIPGVVLKKVDVDIEELVSWCAERGCPVNGSARVDFVAAKMQKMSEEGQF